MTRGSRAGRSDEPVWAIGTGKVATPGGQRFLAAKEHEGSGPQFVVAPAFVDEARAKLRATGWTSPRRPWRAGPLGLEVEDGGRRPKPPAPQR